MATYDALLKVIDWVGDEIYDYFLLVDEYHILFNSYAFRYEAITTVLNTYKRFKHFCFMTATPLDECNILTELADLDRMEIRWPQAVAVEAIVRDTGYTSKEVVKEIEIALNQDYNLHIFINSITTIRSVIKQITTKDFRTICSKNAENNDKRLGGKLQVKSINSPVCKVNFYTATAFEGVDIYDSVGKTIVVSDTNISQSLVDISTLFIQICGRLRDSIYKDSVLFICNTGKHRYLKAKDMKEFNAKSLVLVSKAQNYESEFLKENQGKQEIDIGAWDNSPLWFQDQYIGKKPNILFYDENLRKLDLKNYSIVTSIFKSTISVLHNLRATKKVKAKKDNVHPIYYKILEAIPQMQVEANELNAILYPIWKEFQIVTDHHKASILERCSTKRRIVFNGRKIRIYDFNKLKALI